MIQRIQTLYLALGAVGLLALLFFEVVWQGAAATSYTWFTPATLGVGGLAAVAALGAIFLYKDRARQRKIIVLAQGLTVLLLIVFCGGLYLGKALFIRTAEGIDLGMLLALLLPLLAYLLFWLARRRVEKDIELVRSMDRLR